MWPHRQDFEPCRYPRLTLVEEVTLSNATMRDERSANRIAAEISNLGLSECPPPESGLFLSDEDIEYIDE